MERLRINLFGLFEASTDGVPVRMPTRRVELLLALLAIETGKAQSRSGLAAAIWPGQAEAQAKASLRQAIYRLRTALGPAAGQVLDVTPSWLKLKREGLVLDIDALAVAEGAVPPEDLPNGTPLEGLVGFDPEIDNRLDAARAELRGHLLKRLEDAERVALADHRFGDLERFARRHLVLDGYDEFALRMLMTALWRQGRRNAALDVFQDTSARIRTDLSVQVGAETRALLQEIRSSSPTAEPASPAHPEPRPTAAKAQPRGVLSVPSSDTPLDAPSPHLRHLAVMYVVSARLLAAMNDDDPEAAEAGSRAAIFEIEEKVKREGGEVVGVAGQDVVCVFGGNRPDERPALSAAFAAFEIARHDCAIGVHVGRTLVGGSGQSYPVAMIAQAIAKTTSPGEVRLSAPVADACRGAFRLEPLLPEDGVSLEMWRLSGEAFSRGSFDIRRARGLTPFVGRRAEIDAVTEVSKALGPRATVFVGEAGIGKSRLAHEILGMSPSATTLRVEFTRGATGGGISCFTTILSASTEGVDTLADRMATIVPDETVRTRLLTPLRALGGDMDAMRSWLEAPRGRRMQTMADALLALLGGAFGRDAILLVEDAHWADEDGALLLSRLVRSLDGAGPMVIVTQRPGAADTWSGCDSVNVITLRPLPASDAATLLSSLDPHAAPSLLQKAEGVPLFLEELARAAGDDPVGVAGPKEVPLALSGVLSHRIDTLSSAPRRVLEVAAVLGAEPTDDLLRPLSEMRLEAYDAAISALADADILFRIRSVPQRVYGFKHALVQDAAYLSIPQSRRAALHAAVVAICEPQLRTDEHGFDATLAHHAFYGELYDDAVRLGLRAAEKAIATSAYPLAERMVNLALKAVEALDPDPDNRRLEAQLLKLRRPLAWPLSKLEYVDDSLARSEAIARDLRDDRLIAEICVHRAYRHTDDGRPVKALAFCDAARDAALASGNDEMLAESALARCQTYAFQGRMRLAVEEIADYQTAWNERRSHRGDFVVTRYVMLHHLLTRAHAVLGEDATALLHAKEALSAARATGRPIDFYKALRGVGQLAFAAGEDVLAKAAFLHARQIAYEAELPNYVHCSDAELAEVELRSGSAEEAFQSIERLLAMGVDGLNLIPRLSAEAALLSHHIKCGHENALAQTYDLLHRVRSINLPFIEFRILKSLEQSDPERSIELALAAANIVREQRYSACRLSPGSVEILWAEIKNPA